MTTASPTFEQQAREALAAEKAAYAARKTGGSCDRCKGSGRVLIVMRDARGLPLGRAAPCVACRPEDAQRLVEQLRSGAA